MGATNQNNIINQVKDLKNDLARSIRLLKETQKVARLGSWEIDIATNDVKWSDQAFEILGTTKKKTTPSLENFLSFIHPDDLSLVRSIIRISLSCLKDYSFCCRIEQSGTIKYVYCKGIFEFDQNKNPIRLYGIIHNVSEFKKMQNKICLSEMLGQENERERLSKELHDGLGQILVGISLQLTSISNSQVSKNNELAKKLSTVNSIVKDTIQEVRTISHNMSPHMLKKYGLVISLQNICKSTDDIKLSFLTNLKKPLEQSTEIILYRITQELVTNILKHSKANKAKISLLQRKKEIFLTIEDNGRGLNEKGRTEGLGLASIKNRIHMVSGNFRIISNNNKGTKIKISIPL